MKTSYEMRETEPKQKQEQIPAWQKARVHNKGVYLCKRKWRHYNENYNQSCM